MGKEKQSAAEDVEWPADLVTAWPRFSLDSPTANEIKQVKTWFTSQNPLLWCVEKSGQNMKPQQLEHVIATALECRSSRAWSKVSKQAVEANLPEKTSKHANVATKKAIGLATAEAVRDLSSCQVWSRPWKKEAKIWVRDAFIALAPRLVELGKREIRRAEEAEIQRKSRKAKGKEKEQRGTKRKRSSDQSSTESEDGEDGEQQSRASGVKRPRHHSPADTVQSTTAISTTTGKTTISSRSGKGSSRRGNRKAQIAHLPEEDVAMDVARLAIDTKTWHADPLSVYSLLVVFQCEVDGEMDVPPYVLLGICTLVEFPEALGSMEEIRCDHLSWDLLMDMFEILGHPFETDDSMIMYEMDVGGVAGESVMKEITDTESLQCAIGTLYIQSSSEDRGVLQLSVMRREEE